MVPISVESQAFRPMDMSYLCDRNAVGGVSVHF